MNTRIIAASLLFSIINTTASATGFDRVLYLRPPQAANCLAVEVPTPSGQALSGLRWYHNDGQVAFPRIALLEGARGEFPDLAETALIIPDASADSRTWGEIELQEPVTSSTGTAYAVFYFPETATTGIGEGTGPGIGIRRGADAEPFYLTGDGVNWVQFDEEYEIAIEPVYVQGKLEPRILSDMKGELLAQDQPVRYKTELLPPKPNPFNPRVEIAYTLEKAGKVKVTIYDVRGRSVTTLVDATRPAGPNNVIWEGTDNRGSRVASGVYFVRFEAPGHEAQRRLALVR